MQSSAVLNLAGTQALLVNYS